MAATLTLAAIPRMAVIPPTEGTLPTGEAGVTPHMEVAEVTPHTGVAGVTPLTGVAKVTPHTAIIRPMEAVRPTVDPLTVDTTRTEEALTVVALTPSEVLEALVATGAHWTAS